MIAAPALAETSGRTSARPFARKWVRGWRLAVTLTVIAGAATGLVLGWSWLAGGGVFVLLMIAAPCALACLLRSLFSDLSRDKTATELDGTSEWEMRTRLRFPRSNFSWT